jgi:hypothetical protein|tara:strand:- start:14 stop:388 length:375 start_codon:yes stop_codon:yes gene_type:complete
LRKSFSKNLELALLHVHEITQQTVQRGQLSELFSGTFVDFRLNFDSWYGLEQHTRQRLGKCPAPVPQLSALSTDFTRKDARNRGADKGDERLNYELHVNEQTGGNFENQSEGYDGTLADDDKRV